ncbi:MAG: elongation factor G, partial [Chloroflexota bacterium]
TGGHGQYGDVEIDIEPLEPSKGFEFVNKLVGGRVPKEYVPAVEAGIREALENGVLAGFPMLGVRAMLTDGSFHPVDSSEIAFKIAGSMALRQAAEKAKPVLLEPIMKAEIVVPEEYVGDIIGDFTARRGRIEGMESREGIQVIHGHVPLATMFGYATDLRSRTQGRGVYSIEFEQYEEVPKQAAAELLAKARGDI